MSTTAAAEQAMQLYMNTEEDIYFDLFYLSTKLFNDYTTFLEEPY